MTKPRKMKTGILPRYLSCPHMPLFWKPYTSDVTQFIQSLKQSKPSLEAEQRAGRALLWDKAQDRAASAAHSAAKVPQQAYVYQTQTQPKP
jgi:Protein of unknown function (DUF3460)